MKNIRIEKICYKPDGLKLQINRHLCESLLKLPSADCPNYECKIIMPRHIYFVQACILKKSVTVYRATLLKENYFLRLSIRILKLMVICRDIAFKKATLSTPVTFKQHFTYWLIPLFPIIRKWHQFVVTHFFPFRKQVNRLSRSWGITCETNYTLQFALYLFPHGPITY